MVSESISTVEDQVLTPLDAISAREVVSAYLTSFYSGDFQAVRELIAKDFDFKTPTGGGSIVMSEWHVLQENKLASIRIIFDSASFRTIVSQS